MDSGLEMVGLQQELSGSREEGETAEGVGSQESRGGGGRGIKWHGKAEGDKCSLNSAEGMKSVS